jgi:hypothetical protein
LERLAEKEMAENRLEHCSEESLRNEGLQEVLDLDEQAIESEKMQ